jgi:hypothetical protein
MLSFGLMITLVLYSYQQQTRLLSAYAQMTLKIGLQIIKRNARLIICQLYIFVLMFYPDLNPPCDKHKPFRPLLNQFLQLVSVRLFLIPFA